MRDVFSAVGQAVRTNFRMSNVPISLGIGYLAAMSGVGQCSERRNPRRHDPDRDQSGVGGAMGSSFKGTELMAHVYLS